MVVAALAALMAVTGGDASAAPVDDLRRRIQDSQHELEAANQGLAVVTTSVEETRAALADVDARLTASTQRLGELEAELAERRDALASAEQKLATAERELATAQGRTQEATRALDAATEELRRTEAELDREQTTFETQAADAFKRGRTGQVGGLLQVVFATDSPGDAARGLRVARSVLAHQDQVVQRLDWLRAQVAAHRQTVAALRRQRMVEEAVARAAREDVADLTEQRRVLVAEQASLVGDQRDLVAQITADQASQQDLLRRLHVDQRSYEGLVSHLEAESQRLENELAAELARLAREQRAAAARAAKAAAKAAAEKAAADKAAADKAAAQKVAADKAVNRTAAKAPAQRRAQTAVAQPGSSDSGQLAWPTAGRVTSGFGWRTHPVYRTRRLHAGIDIPAPTGQAIVAAADGVVVSAGWRGGYGNAVVIAHSDGLATLYAHQSRLAVRAGQRVRRGQVIGAVGSTGLSTGPHLHFEVRVNGVPRDPMRYY
ncbi:MAG: peptidoglycan DD-metalloendopeptidase family protein [Actinomycetota bacterium]|nr:peptidoglycan DD-metalloendopeptidase family protein [Actinomycetota bacterium]